jgi:site-specific DNA-methyltransferase (adenine-specific)
MKKIEILNGESLEVLKQYPDNYFDAVVTDPPYGLGKEPNAEQMLQAWITSGYLEVKGSGFMGKEWDAFVPQPIFWKEVFRVLKHGGHVVAFYGTRTYDWGVMAMRLAGFEVRDCIQWIYGSGFPKSYNIGKAIDKIQGNERKTVGEHKKGSNGADGIYNNFNLQADITKGQSEWEGWGSALKPANEPIVLARKPLEKGLTIAENVLKWGTGAINIDVSRVGNLGGTQRSHQTEYPKKEDGTEDRSKHWARVGHDIEELKKGRFPANLILTHHPECECKNKETIESWNCHEDCPIKIMDEQSFAMGIHSAGVKRDKEVTSEYDNSSFHAPITRQMNRFGDKGGASRFFYVAKASKKERNKGLEGFNAKQMAWSNQAKAELKRGNTEFADNTKMHNKVQERINFHPTVKPVALMQYLVRMITPPNGIVLDPFNGSGTTGVACKVEGFNYLGIELDAEYCKISEARIEGWKEEIQMPETIEQKKSEKENIDGANQLTMF